VPKSSGLNGFRSTSTSQLPESSPSTGGGNTFV
jgi:hypothetical protein